MTWHFYLLKSTEFKSQQEISIMVLLEVER